MTGPVARPWLVIVCLALGVCVSNGFARFAYGLILPAMRQDLAWTYAEAGWINTANALGYVVGAVATLALISRLGARSLFAAGMIGTSVFVLASGLTADLWSQTLWRVLAGVFGAPVFIAGGALAAAVFPEDPRRTALAIALYFGGGGVGMVASGAVIPHLFAARGDGAWDIAWMLLGGASLAICPVTLWAVRRLQPGPTASGARAPLPTGRMIWLLAGYGLFAMGYIVYLTFLVAWMRTLDAGPALASAAWIVVGIAVMASPFVWRAVLTRFASGVPLALATATTAVGTLLPVLAPSAGGLLMSAAVFGIAVFIAPSAVTNFSRRNLPQSSWGPAVSLFTTVFAVGQTIGPVAAGLLGDLVGSIGQALLAAGLVLLLGAALAAVQKPLATPAPARA
jgi:MFS family permease